MLGCWVTIGLKVHNCKSLEYKTWKSIINPIIHVEDDHFLPIVNISHKTVSPSFLDFQETPADLEFLLDPADEEIQFYISKNLINEMDLDEIQT